MEWALGEAYQELLFDLAQSLQPRLELEVVVGLGLGNGRHDGDPVALGANVMCGGHGRDVDVCKESVAG